MSLRLASEWTNARTTLPKTFSPGRMPCISQLPKCDQNGFSTLVKSNPWSFQFAQFPLPSSSRCVSSPQQKPLTSDISDAAEQYDSSEFELYKSRALCSLLPGRHYRISPPSLSHSAEDSDYYEYRVRAMSFSRAPPSLASPIPSSAHLVSRVSLRSSASLRPPTAWGTGTPPRPQKVYIVRPATTLPEQTLSFAEATPVIESTQAAGTWTPTPLTDHWQTFQPASLPCAFFATDRISSRDVEGGGPSQY